jgi:hypothetical protein
MTKKVYANKSESAASVIGKVLNASDENVVLYIPRGSDFSKSRNNFLLLKREARVIGKNVSVESVDDDILELAVTAGLKASNPFLGRKQKAVSDIVIVRDAGEGDEPQEVVDDSGGDGDLEDEKDYTAEKKRKLRRPGRKKDRGDGQKKVRLSVDDTEADEEEVVFSPSGYVPERRVTKSRAGLLKKPTFWILGSSVLVGGIIAAVFFLPRVTIGLEFEKTDWNFVGSLNVGTSISQNSFSNDVVSLRGVSFSERKNITKTYAASGSDSVERKAKGVITVYNEFSSEPQELVATTRFETPDGKVYRMDEGVVVPGASSEGGKIVRSSIDVRVTADEAGEKFNVGPVSRFGIPGFQGSAKYDGFYGESKTPMTGGFIGERKIATDDDIASARADILGALEDSAKSQLFLNLPDGTKVLDGTYNFEITEEVVDEGESDSDMFTITVFGKAEVVVFREDELLGVFEERVESDAAADVDLVVDTYTIDYGEPRDLGEGLYGVAINVNTVWTHPLDVDEFRQNSIGKNEAELKSLIFSVPGVQSGEVRFWPFWVNRVPDKESRIVVDVK